MGDRLPAREPVAGGLIRPGVSASRPGPEGAAVLGCRRDGVRRGIWLTSVQALTVSASSQSSYQRAPLINLCY